VFAVGSAGAVAPYEFIEILVNDKTYGGGGIFNDQATASVDSAFSDYVFVHEFGRHFAALADEYYTSDVAYQTGASDLPEPWEPNVTSLKDPATLKWRDLVEPGTPLPHAVGEGALRSGEPRDTRTAPRDQGAQRPQNGDGCTLPRRTRT